MSHGRRFFIQVLCWTEGTTAIHRHGFSGAFQVLEGTSLHTRYAFRTERRVSSRLLLGEFAARADLHTGYLVLSEVARGARHGAEVAERLRAVVLEEMRDRLLVGLRRRTEDADARYLLVLLASLQDRAPIVELVRPRRRGRGPVRVDPRAAARAVGHRPDRARPRRLHRVVRRRAPRRRLRRARPRAPRRGRRRRRAAAQREQAPRHLARIRRSALAPLFRVAP